MLHALLERRRRRIFLVGGRLEEHLERLERDRRAVQLLGQCALHLRATHILRQEHAHQRLTFVLAVGAPREPHARRQHPERHVAAVCACAKICDAF